MLRASSQPVAMLRLLGEALKELQGLSGSKYALELVLASKQDAFGVRTFPRSAAQAYSRAPSRLRQRTGRWRGVDACVNGHLHIPRTFC